MRSRLMLNSLARSSVSKVVPKGAAQSRYVVREGSTLALHRPSDFCEHQTLHAQQSGFLVRAIVFKPILPLTPPSVSRLSGTLSDRSLPPLVNDILRPR